MGLGTDEHRGLLLLGAVPVLEAPLQEPGVDLLTGLQPRLLLTAGLLHQVLVRHWTDGVLHLPAVVPVQLGPVPPHLHPDLRAVVGLGEAPLKAGGPVTCNTTSVTGPWCVWPTCLSTQKQFSSASS